MSDDLRTLIADLGKASREVFTEGDKVLKKGAHVIAEDIRAQVDGRWAKSGLGRAVSYDSMARPGALRYEVGFDKMRKAGALGNIWEFGVTNRQGAFGGGSGDMEGALEREAAEVERRLTDLAGGLL